MVSGEFRSRRRYTGAVAAIGATGLSILFNLPSPQGKASAERWLPSFVQRAAPQHWVDYLPNGNTVDVSVVCDYTWNRLDGLQPSIVKKPWQGFPTDAHPDSWRLFPDRNTRNTFHVSVGIEGTDQRGDVQNLTVMPQGNDIVTIVTSYPLDGNRSTTATDVTIPSGYELDDTIDKIDFGIGNSAGRFTVAVACNETRVYQEAESLVGTPTPTRPLSPLAALTNPLWPN